MTEEEAGYAHAKDTSVLHDLTHLGGKNLMNMAHALKDLSSGEPMDDRKLMLENGGELEESLLSEVPATLSSLVFSAHSIFVLELHLTFVFVLL